MHATIKQKQLVAFLTAIGISVGLWILGVGSALTIGSVVARFGGADGGPSQPHVIVARLSAPKTAS